MIYDEIIIRIKPAILFVKISSSILFANVVSVKDYISQPNVE